MATGFTLEQMRARLAELEAEFAEDREFVRVQVAWTRRWLDLGGDSELFAEDARDLVRNTETHGTAGPYFSLEIGGLFHLAGNDAAARPFLLDASRNGSIWPSPQAPAGAHYLLGEHERAAALASGAPEGLLAQSTIDGNPGLARQARDELLSERPSGLVGPHQEVSTGGMALSTWDWIEESFLLEARLLDEPAPTHLEMLRRTGRLLDAEPPPRRDPPRRPGFATTIRTRPPGATEVTASLTVDGDGEDVDFVLDPRPDRYLSISVRPPDGGPSFDVGIATDPMSDMDYWMHTPVLTTFQEAAEYAAEHFKQERPGAEGAWLADTIRRLVAAHDAG